MTIANGSTILKADLDGAFSSRIADLRAAKRAGIVAAGVYQLAFDWPFLVDSGTPASGAKLSQSFTVPDDDQELLALGAQVVGQTGTYGLTLTGPLVSPITLSETTTTDPDDFARYVANEGGEPLQVLLRGATYTLTVSTDVVTNDAHLYAWLLLRCRPRRR